MSQFKCPLGEENNCPEHDLFHFAVTKVSEESAARVAMIKELTIRLHTAYKELEAIMGELKKLENPAKGNKNECRNACSDCGADVDAERR